MRSLVLSHTSPDQDFIIPNLTATRLSRSSSSNLTAVSAVPRNVTFNKFGVIGIPYFTMLHFTQILHFFYKLKICGSPSSSKSIGTIFPIAFAHSVFACHSLFILAILQTFSQQHMKTHWGLRWWFSSVQFSRSVMSDSLRPHGLQHARLPCPSATTRACSNSCPSSRWCHLTILLYSIVPFSSCLQSFPASGSFPVSQFFASGGQSIGVSASTSVLPMNIQDWFPLGLTDWISLLSKGLSRVSSNTTVQKHQFFIAQLSL